MNILYKVALVFITTTILWKISKIEKYSKPIQIEFSGVSSDLRASKFRKWKKTEK
ncbi:hypothetical protein [Staphylococcus hominis]|uniref:hypothetical protein n=1 Tax=Staphylococcus hominis TaxID=1290 RepID=UPI001643493F|nr:hypothetical protein [Staphylococcus hominis]MBC2955344.1 hypothetical protein [Staphylococcus hominis]